ncbi:MAG: putative ribosomal N-acetyltransferase YdaF [Mucilaginibacter sp.]|nr:putative ribosomal N-acetyltransferase YdaF [Mucilaginibacter sp.]
MIILETERLLFRQHVMADIENYCAMEMDPEVRRYVGGRPRTREEAEDRFMGSLVPATDRLAMWATIYKPENKYIGRCGVYPHFNTDSNPISGEGSLGLYIVSTHWGWGLATEAGQAFIQFGFKELKLNRIVTSIDTRNDASVRVINKLGFELISTETGPRSFYHFAIFNPLEDLDL